MVGRLGLILVGFGVLTFIFVAYQLWGTGLYAANEQSSLHAQFDRTLEKSARTPTLNPTPPAAAPGEPVAQIRIPKIGVDEIVVSGVSVADLRMGPGHYPESPWPGQAGNAAIAGHRTTYGAPFSDLDQLVVGDTIVVRTVQGRFDYLVTESKVVKPSDVSVLNPRSAATLTLTTCNPKYSAAQRLVIFADLRANQSPLPATASGPAASSAVLNEPGGAITPVVLSGLLALGVGLVWWWLFRRRRRWYVWLAGASVFLVTFLVFSFYLERTLPANY